MNMSPVFWSTATSRMLERPAPFALSPSPAKPNEPRPATVSMVPFAMFTLRTEEFV